MITTVIIAIVCFAVGGGLSYMLFRYGLKSKYDIIIKEAQTEAEVIKKNKLLEVKEKFLNKKADLEKEVALRNQKIQQAENKLKQRELMLNQKQEEVQRKRTEAEAIKENLEAQIVIIDKKKDELDKLQMQEREKLEALSGLSAEEAKERLMESLKEEAKTQAASYINDIMDDAKLTANKEAKRIVIQSIQRVATETAIENSVTVFHIESDEIKGRIIGREGRNIRALEAATGVEIVVDDTPEAIVLSAFDPVRREIARLALHLRQHLRNSHRIKGRFRFYNSLSSTCHYHFRQIINSHSIFYRILLIHLCHIVLLDMRLFNAGNTPDSGSRKRFVRIQFDKNF